MLTHFLCYCLPSPKDWSSPVHGFLGSSTCPPEQGLKHHLPQMLEKSAQKSWCELASVSLCCITNHPNLSGVKQQTCSVNECLMILLVDWAGAGWSRMASLTGLGSCRDGWACLHLLVLVVAEGFSAGAGPAHKQMKQNAEALFNLLLLSCLLMFHWPKQVTWPGQDPNDGQINSTS